MVTTIIKEGEGDASLTGIQEVKFGIRQLNLKRHSKPSDI